MTTWLSLVSNGGKFENTAAPDLPHNLCYLYDTFIGKLIERKRFTWLEMMDDIRTCYYAYVKNSSLYYEKHHEHDDNCHHCFNCYDEYSEYDESRSYPEDYDKPDVRDELEFVNGHYSFRDVVYFLMKAIPSISEKLNVSSDFLLKRYFSK